MSPFPFFAPDPYPSQPASLASPSRSQARPRSRGQPQVANSTEHQAALAYRLTARDRWIVRMVFEHQVLHAGHIGAVAFPSANAARERLRELHHWAVLDRFRPHKPDGASAQHYVLGPAGAQVLASEHGLDVTTLGYRRERAMRIAHSIRLAHTVDRNGWFCALLAHALQNQDRPEARLSAWWSEHRCATLFGDVVRPDGYGHWHEPTAGAVEFFLEYDRGTENTRQVADKLDGYAQLAEQSGVITPVLVWLPTAAREAHVRRRLTQAWQHLAAPHRVPVATASATGLDPHDATASPAGPLWLPLNHTAPGRTTGPRRELGHLAQAWPQVHEPTETAPDWSRRGMLPAPAPMPPAASTSQRRQRGPTHG